MGASVRWRPRCGRRFPNLVVSGVPIFADHFCPKGNCYGVNVKYTSMYMSEDAALDFSASIHWCRFGQIGQQGVVVCGYSVLSAKSVSGFHGYNLQGASF